MSLDETLLQRLNEPKPAGEGRQTLAFADDQTGTAVSVQIERREALSCRLWQVSVTRAAGADLAAWARRLADRVTGLLEALHLHELDTERGVAVLRSESPVARSDERFYYELVLQRTGEAALRRWKGSVQAVPRQQVAFTLTNEALAKLVEDLAAES